MQSRWGIFAVFVFIFMSVIILFQILAMIQSDRLYERINCLEDSLKSVTPFITTQQQTTGGQENSVEQDHPGTEGDWLVWRLGAEPATLNSILTIRDMSTAWITEGNIFESLLEYDYDTVKLKPLLAESYEASPDGLEITFRLRDNIYFSDGKPVTTDDVIFSFQTIKNPRIDAVSLANYFKDFEKVIKISDRDFKVMIKQQYFKSLEIFGGMSIFPKHIYKFDDPVKFNKHHSNPVGSGPYVFEKWNVGQKIVLRRNERYWGRKPKLKKIVYPFILNDAAALQALRSGQIDFMRPLPEQYGVLSEDQEFKEKFQCLSYWNPGAGYFYVAWNQDTPFFKDRKVRLAMTHIIDREAICEHLLKGTAQVPTGPFYIFSAQNNASIKPWPYNLETARKLLDEAGWRDTDGDGIRDKNGVAFRFKYMIVSSTVLHEQIAKLVKDFAAKVGIEVVPDPYEWSVFINRVQNRLFEATNLAWGGAVQSDPYQIWHSSQIGNHGSNYVGFNISEADAIIEEARRTMDEEKRNKLYHRFHQILHNEQPYTFVYTRPSQRFLQPRFKNVTIHKLGLNPHEWYVPRGLQKYK